MAANYALVIKTRAGVAKYILTGGEDGFRWLSYRKEVNGPGLLMFDLDGDHAAIADLEQDGQIDVYRKNDTYALAWTIDYGTLYKAAEYRADDDGLVTFRALCPGYLSFLRRAIVAWAASTANRSLFSAVKASTIMTNLVRYNATSDATTGNGRERTTDLANITYETDDDDGNVITANYAHDNLLDALQDVAAIGDRDFWLDRTGAQAWTFRTDNYLGDDLSATVVFALNFGNMANPVLRVGSLDERTVAIVGGQGLVDNRTVIVRTGTNYNGTYNSSETFVPATDTDTTAGLQAAGDVRLREVEARNDLTWDAIQTPTSAYQVHYDVGDLVTGKFLGVSQTKQVVAAVVTFAPSNERAEIIAIETGNI